MELETVQQGRKLGKKCKTERRDAETRQRVSAEKRSKSNCDIEISSSRSQDRHRTLPMSEHRQSSSI